MGTLCELCEERAAVYCCADEAYVCWTCDSKVHGANFIVARHLRSVLCCRCQAPTLTLAGAVRLEEPVCPTCGCSTSLELLSDFTPGPDLSTAVHSQHSSTTTEDDSVEEVSSVSRKRKRRRSRSPSPISVIPGVAHVQHSGSCSRPSECMGTEGKLEVILEGWNRQMGLMNSEHTVCVAMQLLRRLAGSIKCNQVEKLDARSALAACLWISLKLESGSSVRPVLPKVDKFEKCTGISAEVVLSVEAKLCQVCNKSNLKSSELNLDLAL